MPVPNEKPQRPRKPRPPSDRDCRIYERHVLNGERQDVVAADYKLTRQRVAQIAGDVEGWIAGHPEHPLAKSMRVRCTRRWEALWAETMDGFNRSRENREVTVERTSRAQAPAGGREPQVTVVQERTVRQHPGDVRFLQVALRVADRQQRLLALAQVEMNAFGHRGNLPGSNGLQWSERPQAVCFPQAKWGQVGTDKRGRSTALPRLRFGLVWGHEHLASACRGPVPPYRQASAHSLHMTVRG